jgi:methyl-accepting chemotaxis protein
MVLTTSYSNSISKAHTIALLTSKGNADKVTLTFEKIETIGKSLALQMETTITEGKPSRELVMSVMKRTISLSDNIFGVAITYEPNKFDGKDDLYMNRVGSDSKGQFMPYITTKDRIQYASELCFYDTYTEIQNLWYTVPKQTHKVYMTEPTIYPVQGDLVPLVSIVIPIMRNGEFVGVVSIDTTIDYLQTEIEKVRPMGGHSQIISQKGIFVANGVDPDKTLTDISNEPEWIPILKKVTTVGEFTEVGYSADTDEKVLRVFSSIHLKDTNEFWTYVSILPLSVVYANFNYTFALMVIVGLVLLGFIVYVNYEIIIKDI